MERSRPLHLAVIALTAAIAFFTILPNNFGFDTPNLLLDNKAVHGLSLANLTAIFTSLPNGVEYLPVRDLTYCVDYELWGLNPLGYNLSNVVYYALCCLALYLFLEKLLAAWTDANRMIAFLSALLFACHPVHVESVAGVAQRKDLVSGLFFFLSLRLFLDHRTTGKMRYAVLSLAAFLLSMLSKSTAVVLPLLLLLIDAARGMSVRDRRVWLATAPFFVVSLLVSGMALFIGYHAGTVLDAAAPFGIRLLTAARAVFVYLKILLVPYPLTIWHDQPQQQADMISLIAALAMLVWLFVLARYRRAAPALFFFSGFFLITLIPVVGLVPAPNLIAERYLFLPSAGFAAAGAWLLWKSGRRLGKGFVAVMAISIVTAYLAVVLPRNMAWRTNGRLFSSELQLHPDSIKIQTTVARYHFANKRYDEAFALFRKIKEVRPNNIEYDFHRAYYFYLNGRYDAAREELQKVLPFGSDIIDVHYLFGRIAAARGETQQAAASYRSALACKRTIGIFFKSDVEEGIRQLGSARRQ